MDKTGDITLGFKKEGSARKGLAWVKDTIKQGKKLEKGIMEDNAADYKVEALAIKPADPTEDDLKKEKKRRDNLTYYQHIEEGINNIFAHGQTVAKSLEEVRVLLRDSFAAPLSEQFAIMKPLTATMEISAKADKNNIVEKEIKQSNLKDSKSGGTKQEWEKFGDGRDTVQKVNSSVIKARETWKTFEKMPLLKDLTKLIKLTTQKAAYKYVNDMVINAKIVTGLADNASQKDKDEAERKALVKAVDEYTSRIFKDLLESTIGEENANELLALEESYYAIKKPVTDTLKIVVDSINYAKKCVSYVQNVTSGIQNLRTLSSVNKSAKQRRAEDDEKLKKAGEKRLSDEQAEMVSKIVDKHRGMADLGNDITAVVQEFNIAGETVNMAIRTATIAGGKLNLGQEAIAKVVKEGLQFALFALRIAADRNALADYFLHTEAGRQMIEKTRSGFTKLGDDSLTKSLDEAIETQKKMGVSSLVDIISDAKGYEHTSELVENTAMSMAQSIVFSASNYNPMAETRLMAITVMSIMGLDKEIGSTSPDTVEKLFKKFNVSR